MNRMINIILTELANDKLKYEEDMEKAINGSESSDERVKKVKYNLEKIVLTEKMIERWKTYVSSETDNHDNK